jgi:hypothetical protein
MNPVILKWIRIIIAVVIGYSLMGLLITAVQEWIFHGVSYNKSSLPVLAVAGLGTFLSAVTGGWVAFRINAGKTQISNLIMSVLVIIETTWILLTFKAESPMWFDILAALSLILGIMLGCNLGFLMRLK